MDLMPLLNPYPSENTLQNRCTVCGAEAKGFNYGALSCQACKVFFLNTIKNKYVYNCR